MILAEIFGLGKKNKKEDKKEDKKENEHGVPDAVLEAAKIPEADWPTFDPKETNTVDGRIYAIGVATSTNLSAASEKSLFDAKVNLSGGSGKLYGINIDSEKTYQLEDGKYKTYTVISKSE